MTGPPDRSRRRALAGVGTVATTLVAGCSFRSWNRTETDGMTHVSPSELEPVLAASAPDVDRPVPVEPADVVREGVLSRVDELLADVPDPVDAEVVPNGVVRAEIETARDDARSYRDAADVTGSKLYHAVREDGRRARESARKSAATMAAVDDRSLVEDLSVERDEIRSTIDARLDALEYRGADTDDGRLRAALFAAEFEGDLTTAHHRVRRWEVDEHSDVVEIGDGAGDVEFSEATVATWDHLVDRYDETLAEPADLEAVFADALEESIDRAEDVDLPDQGEDDWLAELVEGEIEQGFTQTVLWDAIRPVYDARDGMTDAAADGRLGDGLSDAVRFEQTVRAFDIVRDRVEDGGLASPDSVDPVRTEREAAIDAAESTLTELTTPSLGAARLAETVRLLTWADNEVRRRTDADPDTVVPAASEYGEYARLRAQFEVLPEAVSAVRARLLE